VKNFGLQIYEDIKTAEKVIHCRDKAMIGQGTGVAGSTLALVVGFSAGGPLGCAIALGSIVFGGISAKRGLEAYNVGTDVVKRKEDYEKILHNIEEKYTQLCDQHVAVKTSFRTVEELVAAQ